MSYSINFRKAVIEYNQRGHTIKETSETFNVSVYAILDWKILLKEKESFEKRDLNCTFKKIDPALFDKYVEEHPDACQKEIALAFNCSPSAIRKALKKLKIKRFQEQDSEKVKE